MCSNYKDNRRAKEVAEFFKANLAADFEFPAHRFPWAPAPVLVMERGDRVLKPMRFGMATSRDEGKEKPKPLVYNSRVETVAKFPAFADAFRKRRCIVPMQGFYEFVERKGMERKMRIWIAPKDGRALGAAGIWNVWTSESGISFHVFSVLTGPPPKVIEEAGHDRCPLYLREHVWDDWLAEGPKDPKALHKILQAIEPVEWAIKDEPLTVKPKTPREKAGLSSGDGTGRPKTKHKQAPLIDD